MKTLNLLFLGGAKRVSLASHLIYYGKSIGVDVNVYSYELDRKVPIAAVGKVVVGKRWKDDDLMEDLTKCVRENSINVVLPFVDPAIAVASRLKNLCPDVFIPVSDVEICETMFDKVIAAKWFEKNGIPQPDVYWNRESVKFPVILKPRTGSASKGIVVCHCKEDLPQSLDGFLMQKYIEDKKEISVDCYVGQDGEVLSVVPRIRLETAGGEAVRSVTVRNEKVIGLSLKILKSGNFRGPVTLQFLESNDGSVYVMEINPRLGGGVVCSIGAGSGLPEMLVGEALGRKMLPKEDWKDGTVMVRYFKEVIFYADNN